MSSSKQCASTEQWCRHIQQALSRGHVSVAKALATGGAAMVVNGVRLHAPATWVTTAVASALAPIEEA